MLEGNDGGGVVVKDGTLVASKGVNGISVGPCFAEHNYTSVNKEGSMGRMDGCFTAYLTAYSTFDRTIALRAVAQQNTTRRKNCIIYPSTCQFWQVLFFAGKYNLLHIHAPRRLLRGGGCILKAIPVGTTPWETV